MKILIIEDEPSLSELIEREVISEGYVAECARDFISAETKIVGYNYDCILLDISLPGGSGLELLANCVPWVAGRMSLSSRRATR